MKHLKTFESFEKNNQNNEIPVAKYQLGEDERDDLNFIFDSFVEQMEEDRKEKISHDELLDLFSVDDKNEISDDFVRFLDDLAQKTSWFSYQPDMMDKVKNDLSILIGGVYDYDEDEEDFEYAQQDPNWPYEEEIDGNLASGGEAEVDDIEELRRKTYSKEPSQKEISDKMDSILDKINMSGYDSLTDEEKDFLNKKETIKISNFYNFYK